MLHALQSSCFKSAERVLPSGLARCSRSTKKATCIQNCLRPRKQGVSGGAVRCLAADITVSADIAEQLVESHAGNNFKRAVTENLKFEG